jgi:hypothetical protein
MGLRRCRGYGRRASAPDGRGMRTLLPATYNMASASASSRADKTCSCRKKPMSFLEKWDADFASLALDTQRRGRKIKRLVRLRMVLVVLFGTVAILLVVSTVRGQVVGEIQNDRLLLLLLILVTLYRTESNIRLLRIVGALRKEMAGTGVTH